jgi:hypothetical protein
MRSADLISQSSICRWIAGLILVLIASSRPAGAVPSFAAQTGQPCAACHVGAFGPQLTPFGRDFKLYGYTATNGKPWTPPIAMTLQTSFTHTRDPQPGGAARWFAPNDNPALDQSSLYYAGRIDAHTGAFVELMYDGVARLLQPGNIDVRHVRDFTLFNIDAVGGITLNNAPSVQDLWNSTPVWGFPYNRSPLAPTPGQAVLSDGALSQRMAGLGLYAMWSELLYTEITAYRGLGHDVLNATKVVPVTGAPGVDGFVPYWRVAVQKDLQRHFFQVGTYGLNANIFPGGNQSAGTADSYNDVAADATYQFIVNPKSVVSDMLSAHAVMIHEDQSLGASSRLLGTNGANTLDTFRADASYSFGATVTPTLQYFRTSGTADAVQFNTANGRPNSSGVVAEVAYVPWGKPDSPIQFLNLRLAVQYIAYTEFDGTTHGASANNTLYLSLWGALHF